MSVTENQIVTQDMKLGEMKAKEEVVERASKKQKCSPKLMAVNGQDSSQNVILSTPNSLRSRKMSVTQDLMMTNKVNANSITRASYSRVCAQRNKIQKTLPS